MRRKRPAQSAQPARPRGDLGHVAPGSPADEDRSPGPYQPEHARRELDVGARPAFTVSQSPCDTSATPSPLSASVSAARATNVPGPATTSRVGIGLPTDVTETGPLVGMDVDANPLVSESAAAAVTENARVRVGSPGVYGYEPDDELRAKARDLELR